MAPRGKIVLARISDGSKRRACLIKRKSGLLKKVSELTTLCDAEAAVVVYSPDDNQTTVWPSTPEAKATISKFLSRPRAERTANSHTAKSFTEKKCKKKMNKAQRLIKMNEEGNIQALITSICNGKTRIQDLDLEQKKKLSAFADKKKEELQKQIQRLKRKEQQVPHSPQVLPPAPQMPPAGQAASGLNMNGRKFSSPGAGNGQLVNVSGMIRLAPHLSLSPSMYNRLIMSPINSEANRLDITRRLYGQTKLGRMMQRAPDQHQVLPPTLQMRPVSHVTSGLDINGFAGGKSFPSSAAAAHAQHMNLRGLTRGAPSPLSSSLPTPNPLAMSPNNSVANRLELARPFNGQTNVGSMMQHPLPSPSSMPPPVLSTVPTVFSAGGVPDMIHHSLVSASTGTQIGEGNFRRMKQHAPPPSLAHDFSPIHWSSNRFDMTGRLYKQTNFGGMTHHFLPSPSSPPPPSPLVVQPGQFTASGPDMTDNGLINASTRTFTGNGDSGGMIQRGPPYVPLERPRRLGLPPMPPTQHEASGSNTTGDEYSCYTIGFPTPATEAPDQSNFDDGISNGGWVEGDTAYEVNNAPPFEVKW